MDLYYLMGIGMEQLKKGTHKAAGPLKGGKYSLWEGGTRVPLLHISRKIKTTCLDAVVSQLDLYATIADIIDIPIPKIWTRWGKRFRCIDGESSGKILCGTRGSLWVSYKI